MQFEIWDFPDPDMRFLLDEILKVLPTVKVQPDKKLVFMVRGVENAIGMTGEYPPMLVDFKLGARCLSGYGATSNAVLFAGLCDYASC